MAEMRLTTALFAALLSLVRSPAQGTEALPAATLSYRGFAVDLSPAAGAADLPAIETSLRHQLDIVADCGAKSDVMAFFRAQRITVAPDAADTGGQYDRAHGIRIDAVPQPVNEPIVLHELLHAYQAQVLPQGFANPGVLTFYRHAKEAGLYPPDAFLLQNPGEFFAVTASLYLYGHVDRPPFTRETLREKQPYYYAWLAELFGVKK